MLDASFKRTDLIEKGRKVRTLAGVRFFGKPIGTPITAGMVTAAKNKHGAKATEKALVSQQRGSVKAARSASGGSKAKSSRSTPGDRTASLRTGKPYATANPSSKRRTMGDTESVQGWGPDEIEDMDTLIAEVADQDESGEVQTLSSEFRSNALSALKRAKNGGEVGDPLSNVDFFLENAIKDAKDDTGKRQLEKVKLKWDLMAEAIEEEADANDPYLNKSAALINLNERPKKG